MVTRTTGHPLQRALAELREERARLDKAIRDIEALVTALGVTAGGRMNKPVGRTKARKAWSAAARKAAAARMKRYWAQRRKQSARAAK